MKPASVLALLLALLAVPALAAAQGPSEPGPGVLVRVDGDVTVGPDEAVGTVVQVGENTATIQGNVTVLVVVGGTARIDGGTVADMTVVGGTAELANGATVGHINLQESELTQSEDSTVTGEVDRNPWTGLAQGPAVVFGILFFLGISVAIILAGELAAAVAADQVRKAGAVLSDEIGKTLLSSLILWVGVPILAGITLLTIVGIPTALLVLLFLLPALWVLGYLIAGIRLGDWLVTQLRDEREAGHPYLAALTGLVALQILALVPVLGALVTPLAGLIGGGALALAAWRGVRGERAEPRRPPVAPSGGEQGPG